MADDPSVGSIIDCQTDELKRLKGRLYREATQMREKKERVERTRKKEEAARRKAEQPAPWQP